MKFYQDGASTSVGGSAVAVPGQMKGLGELHSKYGLLPWKDLITPSISLARDGVEVCEDLRTVSSSPCTPPDLS
jgi:gamma-glutamyltranspeptidase/glutathione hydrolase